MDVYWLEQTEGDVPADNDWLSASELTRLDGLRIAKRRADWRLGRWTAKQAVAAYLNVPSHCRCLAHIEVRVTSTGAPEVSFANEPAVAAISLSHRCGRAVCAVAPYGGALGCDLETIEPRSGGFIADYFTDEEQAMVARASPADRFRLLALLWSGKESALKALRVGLQLDTRCVVVSPLGPLPESYALNSWRPLEVRCIDGQMFQGWWQHTGGLLRSMVSAPACTPPKGLKAVARRD
ncbi:MAG TPA: 4'-phosphopantetheinyl transferase superfamily protein [Bryobacteraceae bacterium]|nr:4'-phosphopantetheinyl transferase superfamily protein [Bryobacteraceae bacterium]